MLNPKPSSFSGKLFLRTKWGFWRKYGLKLSCTKRRRLWKGNLNWMCCVSWFLPQWNVSPGSGSWVWLQKHHPGRCILPLQLNSAWSWNSSKEFFGVNWNYRINTLHICFSKAVRTHRLLEVCLVMETLSRVQAAKTSLTSLWSDIAADQLETGNGELKEPKVVYPDSIPDCWRGRNSLYPGHLSPSMPVPPLCLQEQPLSGVVSSQPRRKALPSAPCGAELQLCAVSGVWGQGKNRDVSNLCTDTFFGGTSSINLSPLVLFSPPISPFFIFNLATHMLNKQSLKELSKSKRWGCYTN